MGEADTGRRRAHVVLPAALLRDVDQAVGPRRRSEFVASAVAERLARERQIQALKTLAGAIDVRNYPEWNTPERASAWVHASRRVDEEMRRQAGDPDEA